MRSTAYDRTAKKLTVSLTINADLYAKAKSAGLNASQVAEKALAAALEKRLAETIKSEIQKDIEVCDKYVAIHGSPAELARAHYAERDDAV